MNPYTVEQLSMMVLKERTKWLILRSAIDLLIRRGQVKVDDIKNAVDSQSVEELQATLIAEIEAEIQSKIGTVH